jgi:uncharacterized protein YnzC (UPF0291/DUF896 family)
MNMEALVARINELARKHKTVGLTEEEKLERDRLRRQYIDAFKNSLRSQLDSIRVVDRDQHRIH